VGGRARTRTTLAPEPALWFVTVTVAGAPLPPEQVHRHLETLAHERPFVVSARYRGERAVVRYWDESDDIAVAVAQGLRMWRDHRSSAGLPDWRVVCLEVIDRDTARSRWQVADGPDVTVLGEILPMES
jgi:hypothetical protein